MVTAPTSTPAVPENDAIQFAKAAPRGVNPIAPRRNVPKNDIAIIPLKLTVPFKSIEMNRARRVPLK